MSNLKAPPHRRREGNNVSEESTSLPGLERPKGSIINETESFRMRIVEVIRVIRIRQCACSAEIPAVESARKDED
jgi:hypothetical protein